MLKVKAFSNTVIAVAITISTYCVFSFSCKTICRMEESNTQCEITKQMQIHLDEDKLLYTIKKDSLEWDNLNKIRGKNERRTVALSRKTIDSSEVFIGKK